MFSPLYKDLNAVAAIDLSIDVSYLIQRDRVFSYIYGRGTKADSLLKN